MEAVECGAAALASVLGYHGLWVPLAELRLACGVSRDGSKASNLLKAARELGFTARGFRKEPHTLASVPLPAILFWNFNHFVVLEGLAPDGIALNDPAFGRRSVDWEEFDQSFTGVVLTFEPTERFRPGGRAPSVMRDLQSRLAGQGKAFAFLFTVGLTLVVPGLAIPAFSRLYVDDFLVGGQEGWLVPLVLGMFFSALLRGALSWLQRSYLLRAELGVALVTSARFFRHLLHLPLSYYTQRYAGEIGARLAINERVATLVARELPGAALDIATAAFFLALMASYSLTLTAISLGFASVMIALLRVMAAERRSLNQRVALDQGKVVGIAMSGLMLIESLKAAAAESEFFERWAGFQARWSNASGRQARAALWLGALPPALFALEMALVIGVGGARVMQGLMTLGMLVAYQSLAQSFATPIRSLVNLGAQIQQLQGDMDRLQDVLDVQPVTETAGVAPGDLEARTAFHGRIEFRDVTFGYSRMADPLLKGVSFIVAPGQWLGLVGASGCGKSTISRLIMGLYEPWSGEILLDGVPRRSWSREALAASLVLVDQDIVLFSGSIRDNLCLWDEALPDADLVEAARDAALHEVISARPGGYQNLIEEGGRNFSGGQRQRLELARALACDPRAVVLDEGTSALDPATEAKVLDALRRRGVTCIVIAHRVSAIRDCDTICVMHEGSIVERGRHAELLDRAEGRYRRMASLE